MDKIVNQHPIIKHQAERIEQLEQRIAALEAKLGFAESVSKTLLNQLTAVTEKAQDVLDYHKACHQKFMDRVSPLIAAMEVSMDELDAELKRQKENNNQCTCHERDSSYTCDYCKTQGRYGHMEKK